MGISIITKGLCDWMAFSEHFSCDKARPPFRSAKLFVEIVVSIVAGTSSSLSVRSYFLTLLFE